MKDKYIIIMNLYAVYYIEYLRLSIEYYVFNTKCYIIIVEYYVISVEYCIVSVEYYVASFYKSKFPDRCHLSGNFGYQVMVVLEGTTLFFDKFGLQSFLIRAKL